MTESTPGAASSRRTFLASLLALATSRFAFAEPELDAHMRKVIAAAMAQTTVPVTYDGSYRRIAYPGGDVPANIGVCTDVIIRAYRAIGVDLQQLVHEDMTAAFRQYPRLWGLSGPDPNIDHRRVPNLQTFFRRRGASLPIPRSAAPVQPGDCVTWRLPGNLPHIGLAVDRRSTDGERPLIVHNIGRGPRIEDALFEYPITGHFRFRPRSA
jgi:uncharacterized protein YijF (DUF1287 family)